MNLGSKSLWLFDLDNTLVRDVENPTPFPGAKALWEHLKSNGRTLAVLTNVGRLSANQVHAVLQKAGFDLPLENTFTAGKASAGYIHDRNPHARCFLISEGGARDDFVNQGLELAYNPPIDYVAIGADRSLTYNHLNFAAKMVREGAELVCISGSRDYPGMFLGYRDTFIGERSIVAAIEDATGTKATIVGKPLPEIVETTVKQLGFAKEDAIMVGDNPHSDVAGGKAAGLTTILVRRPDNIVAFDSGDLDTTSDFVVESLENVIDLLK